jgi:hypothetical protein
MFLFIGMMRMGIRRYIHIYTYTYMSNASSSHSVSPIRVHGSNVSKPVEPVLKGNGTNATLVLIDEYIQTLTPFERQGLAIAKDHLGPSFDMKRSTGFLRWKDSKNNK